MTQTVPPNSSSFPQRQQELERGYALLQQDRFEEAVGLANTLKEAYPGDAHVLVFASESSLANDDPGAALIFIGMAIEAASGDLTLVVKKASLLAQMRRRSEACAFASAAAVSASGHGRILWQLGNVLAFCNDPVSALALYEKAHVLLGDIPGLLYETAVAQFFTGRFEEAEGNLDRMLARAPQAGHALYLRATLRRQTPDANHIDDLQKRIGSGFKEPASEAACLYALSKELEDIGHDAESFSILEKAAQRKRSTLQYDVQVECASLQAIRSAYSAATMDENTQGDAGEGAIFIVGMPRTGTTLAERILVQQGSAKSAGELLDFGSLLGAASQDRIRRNPGMTPAEASLDIDFPALGRSYMDGARQAAGGSPVFIDKMPVNYLYCGMIRKALPRARIIHLVRDPLDSCYAVYKTLFFSAYHFSYDLNDLASYYIAYHEMMHHWHTVMPGSVLDVHYEALVTDTETQAQRILQWCGLEWKAQLLDASPDSAAFTTASAAQVREPVHRRSIGRSRKHAVGLTPLVSRLQAAGIIAPDGTAYRT